MKYFILLIFLFLSWANNSYNVWEWDIIDLIILELYLCFVSIISAIDYFNKKS